MKLIWILSVLFLASFRAFAQDDQPQLLKGTEAPALYRDSVAGKCFVFSEYVVKAVQTDSEGDNLSVFKRAPGTSAASACNGKGKGKAYLHIEDSDNNSIYGLSGPYLFVDTGTSAESRGLEVYDLNLRKLIITEGYMNDAKLVDGRFLVFDSPSDKKGLLKTCKEAAKWKRGGGGVGWVQGTRLDLQTLKASSVGPLRCVYME